MYQRSGARGSPNACDTLRHIASHAGERALQQVVSSMSARSPHRLLRAFGRVHGGEGLQAALMLLCVFAIMTSYYMLKTAREALILSRPGWLPGQELKAYAGG